MRTIKLTIQYDGTGYHGWQRQKGRITIQEIMEAAIHKMTGESNRLTASGRTDAGVHALAQVAHFNTGTSIPEQGFFRGLNSLLPSDIAVITCQSVSQGFHSIRDCLAKVYCYQIICSPVPQPLWEKRAWILDRQIDHSAMQKSALRLLGTHDFASFRGSGSSARTSTRTIYFCRLARLEKPAFPYSGGIHYIFTVAADGFLRYMVRNIVGFLVEVGIGARRPEEISAVLASGDRSRAGVTAPPHGLFLKKVFYDRDEWKQSEYFLEYKEQQMKGENMSWTILLAERVRNLKPSPTLAIDSKAKSLKAQGIDIVNLSAGEPDFDTPDHIKEAAIQAIRDGFTKYTPVGGIAELKEAIAAKLMRDYETGYSQNEIMVSTGGKQVLFNVAQALLGPGDEVIVPVPYWVSYPAIIELAGGTAVFLPSDPAKGFSLDITALRSLINPKTRAMILNSPSNPTGAVYSPEDLKAVGELAMEHGFAVITDDIYDEIRFDGKKPENILSVIPEARDHVIVVNGVSKTYAMTGWRIGYMAGPESIVKAASKIQSQSTSNPNSIAQKAAVAALTGPQDCITTMKKAFLERKNFITKTLESIDGVTSVEPAGAFYIFPDLSSFYGKSAGDIDINGSLDMADYLLETARIAAVPGIAFGDDRFMRFSYATDMTVIEEGMNRLRSALEALK
ncbi:MAG TPA: tRNA pseudouridine(38-40) synthase TruA [Thermodesulfobacteriaceae bacterium]|nr:tRNA pseudouridine(38-40) synthase TruA [Thermodesulfobacteriaceae bacterium]